MTFNFSLHFNATTKVAYVKDDTVYSLPQSTSIYTIGSLIAPNNLAIFYSTSIDDAIIPLDSDPRVSENYSLSSPIMAGNYKYSLSNIYVFQNDISQNEFLKIMTSNVFYILNCDLTEALGQGDKITIYDSETPSNDGEYNISAVEFLNGNTRVTIIEETLIPTQEPHDPGAIISFETTRQIVTDKVVTYSSCSTSVCLDLSFTYDAFSTQYGSGTLADMTTYSDWSVLSRELSLYYPAGLSPAPESNPIVTNTSNININVLATGNYTGKLMSTITKAQNDGLYLDLNLTKTKQFTVIAYSEMCGIQDCITKMIDRHVSYLKSSTVSPLQQYVDKVNALYIMAKEALACGNKVDYSSYVSQIYDILGSTQTSSGSCSCEGSCSDCNDSCGCGQPDEPAWIDNLGIDVNSLLADFENFMENQLPTLQSTVDSLNTTVTGQILPAIDELQTNVASVAAQSNNNSGDVTALQDEVTALQDQVSALQDEIDQLSGGGSNSEVVLNELFTNDGNSKLLFMASSGYPATGDEQNQYVLNIPGNVEADITIGEYLSFYSAVDNAWYSEQVFAKSYKSNTNSTSITLKAAVGVPVYWNENNSQFPVFICSPSSDIYNFSRQFTLQNANFWKLEDTTTKYWAKLKTTFLFHSAVQDGAITIHNNASNKNLMIRGILPGSMVDLEITFEKVYISPAGQYDLVYFLDLKSTSSNNQIVVDGELCKAGYTGYAPYQNVDLYQNNSNSGIIEIGVDYDWDQMLSAGASYNLTQDVYNTQGQQNSNRLVSKFASGPSYPNNTANSQFFTGGNDLIQFNTSNRNIAILNFEVSYGKMPA